MRGSKSVQVFLKIGSVVFLILVAFIYLNWSSLKIKATDRIKFKVISDEGAFRIVSLTENTLNNTIDDQLDYRQQYDLRIIAIVYNRAESLLRLLRSLNNAVYDNDKIRLEVWIDRDKNGSIHKNTLEAAHSFVFNHGSYRVRPHKAHVGIYGQWLSTWKPVENSSEIAVILEDDLTVSPYFYRYLKLVHRKYDSYSHINGYALQGVSIKHSGNGLLVPPQDSKVFLYPVVGTWGYSPNKRNWIKFLDWFATAYNDKTFIPLVPGNVASSWYKIFIDRGKSEGMWSMWYIYYAWKHAEFSLYPNLKYRHGLTANWKESGLHYVGKETGSSNPLLLEWKTDYEILPDKPIKMSITGKISPQ